LHSTQNFLSNKSLFAQIGLRTRELRPFYFGDEIFPEISERAMLNVFLHNSLHGSSNSLVLDALELKLDGASEYLILFICTPLKKLSN
jgi:hypothetical protein